MKNLPKNVSLLLSNIEGPRLSMRSRLEKLPFSLYSDKNLKLNKPNLERTYFIYLYIFLTLKVPNTTAANDILNSFFIIYQRK